ncbi:hypothetical protein [Rhizorhabdus sp.]|uniref:hypothetical protein n=1 Tax=Rhizorhabdus sp. TaxID=1968843 RepID=UPI0019BF7956|nr:hypothetical protein [Rhizorhabdus sp.]MBD3762579.1 hypothetical protein [Rhizorhabdus sp.]
MSDLSEKILDALTLDPDAIVKMVGKRMTTLLAAEGQAPGAMLVIPVKDRAPDVPLFSSVTKLIPWAETDKYRLQAIRHDNGLELLLTYD